MKNPKMTSLRMSLMLIVCVLIMSCQDQLADLHTKNDSKKESTTTAVKTDYLIFGHTNGFCLNCDVLYKIENDSIYATKFSTYLNPDFAVFSFLKTVDKNGLVGNLSSEFPSQLFKEVNIFIGTPLPDAGHYYFEVKRGEMKKKWVVEAENLPEYLTSYLADVQSVMNNLK